MPVSIYTIRIKWEWRQPCFRETNYWKIKVDIAHIRHKSRHVEVTTENLELNVCSLRFRLAIASSCIITLGDGMLWIVDYTPLSERRKLWRNSELWLVCNLLKAYVVVWMLKLECIHKWFACNSYVHVGNASYIMISLIKKNGNHQSWIIQSNRMSTLQSCVNQSSFCKHVVSSCAINWGHSCFHSPSTDKGTWNPVYSSMYFDIIVQENLLKS